MQGLRPGDIAVLSVLYYVNIGGAEPASLLRCGASQHWIGRLVCASQCRFSHFSPDMMHAGPVHVDIDTLHSVSESRGNYSPMITVENATAKAWCVGGQCDVIGKAQLEC